MTTTKVQEIERKTDSFDAMNCVARSYENLILRALKDVIKELYYKIDELEEKVKMLQKGETE